MPACRRRAVWVSVAVASCVLAAGGAFQGSTAADHAAAGLASARADPPDLRGAIASLRLACRLEPLSPAHHGNLGVAYMRAGVSDLHGEGRAMWWAMSKQALEHALALRPQDQATHNNLRRLERNVRTGLGHELAQLPPAKKEPPQEAHGRATAAAAAAKPPAVATTTKATPRRQRRRLPPSRPGRGVGLCVVGQTERLELESKLANLLLPLSRELLDAVDMAFVLQDGTAVFWTNKTKNRLAKFTSEAEVRERLARSDAVGRVEFLPQAAVVPPGGTDMSPGCAMDNFPQHSGYKYYKLAACHEVGAHVWCMAACQAKRDPRV